MPPSNPRRDSEPFSDPTSTNISAKTSLWVSPEPIREDDDVKDFIFVHGLGGGSRETWSKTPSDADFWPKRWLPNDPDFEDVRIWSFGYDSIYMKKKSDVLNIDDFGKALLSALTSSKHLGNAEILIVFIGHSMGGLVIKKTYILARRDTSLSNLWKRFQAMCFLATPHRGSDWAQILGRILHVAYRSRAYVGDLKHNSQAIQSINNEFKQYSTDIDIKSFYETQNLSIGFFRILIVEKESATLGYDGEQQIPMYADHRSICKFDSKSDSNYKTIRNVLSQIVQNTIKQQKQSQAKLTRGQLNNLKEYLDVDEEWEDDLIISEDSRVSETCKWITQKTYYQPWNIFPTLNTPPVLWLKGKPSSGKSVLAGYIISELEKRQCDFNYYFFKHGEASKARLSTCLRSIAFQMAQKSAEVRDLLLKMRHNGTRFEMNNDRTIWRKLFLSGVFQAQFSQHYWVIDALDECVDFPERLSNMLVKYDPSLPLRILITSRESPDLEKIISSMGPKRCFSTVISPADTLSDIRLLVEERAGSLMAEKGESRNALLTKVLEKSNGSFLWTILISKELSYAHGTEEVGRILDDVPREMTLMYLRCLENMTRASGGKTLAKAILGSSACEE